ncbi:hypothetical protein E4U43_000080 [Claviceps pusilla]|uniref:Nucleotide exchange factor SIL1 n=1 Tax=Claviceps pusilla TaxID=123648 RepID=A0A9P7NA87_9HYPO|nr:hypothetical protein E4U43_000080 [Claviceps pusilla]
MTRSRSKPLHLQWTLAMLFSLMVCVVFAAPAAAHDAAHDAASTHSKSDLICHTSNPDECYPRIFQPTDEFQIVHDDQEIPKGLHVRLDMSTGKKEAKINVPDEKNPSLEGLPVDRAMVVVEPEPQPDEDPQQPKMPDGAPGYEPVGKVKGPQHESGPFYEGLKMLKGGAAESGGAALDDALEVLEDLAHDLYYGLKIAEDTDAVRALLCLMSSQKQQQQKPDSDQLSSPRDQQAAAILAGALQNNPTALKEVTKAWPELSQAKCVNTRGDDVDHVDALRTRLYASVLPSRNNDGTGATAHQAAARVKSKVAVINGLIKDSSIRAEFLREGGMSLLLSILLPQDKEWTGAQRKVGQLVLDNFLDADMGAVLGQWPTTPRLPDAECEAEEEEAQRAEGCWDYHVTRIAETTRASQGDWSRDLVDRLAAVRGEHGEGGRRNEL